MQADMRRSLLEREKRNGNSSGSAGDLRGWMNRLMSRLDLSCEILGPLLAGWLLLPATTTSTNGGAAGSSSHPATGGAAADSENNENFTAFLIVALLNLLSFVPEL